jgi:hypothetical protein
MELMNKEIKTFASKIGLELLIPLLILFVGLSIMLTYQKAYVALARC